MTMTTLRAGPLDEPEVPTGTVVLDPEVLETYDTLFIHGFHYED